MKDSDKLKLVWYMTKASANVSVGGTVYNNKKPSKTDNIKGAPASATNVDETNPETPTDHQMPEDIGMDNDTVISGSGSGPVLNKSTNNDRSNSVSL